MGIIHKSNPCRGCVVNPCFKDNSECGKRRNYLKRLKNGFVGFHGRRN